MTNIMALAKNNRAEVEATPLFSQEQMRLLLSPSAPEDEAPLGVVVSDGMGSTGQEKYDGYQKVFPIGTGFLLGTGAGDRIQHIATALAKEQQQNPRHLAQRIIELAREDFVFEPGEQLNFILVGNERGSLAIPHVTLPRIQQAQERDAYAFDGSGAPFVGKAIERDGTQGLISPYHQYATIADITLQLYDLGLAATRSSGVNDELQFGFVTPQGNATLLHPKTRVTHPPKEYAGASGRFDPAKAQENTQFYQQFVRALAETREVQRQTHEITTILGSTAPYHRAEFLGYLEGSIDRLKTHKRQVQQMIMAYVARHKE